MAGNAITAVAIPLYVLLDTGSAGLAGIAGAFATAPQIIGGAFGGVLVDRIGYRVSAITADIASGLTVLAIPILASTVGLPFPALLALVFLSGLLDVPGDTAKEVLLPEMAEIGGTPLARAAGIQGAVQRGAQLVGAATAAALIAGLGSLGALYVDAATFGASAVLMLLTVPRPSRPATIAHTERKSGYWADFAEGLRSVWKTPVIRSVVLLVVVTNGLDAAMMLVLRPVYATSISEHGAILGVLSGTFAAGALTGAALFGVFGHRLPRRWTFAVCFLLAGAPPAFAMATGAPLFVVLGVIALSGLAAGPINPILTTVLYEHIGVGKRARVLGVISTAVAAAMPIGSLLGGASVAVLGLSVALASVGTIYLLATLTPFVGRSWSAMDPH